MKHEISEINKVYDEAFFGNIDIEEITDLTYINNPDDPNLLLNRDNFNQILKIIILFLDFSYLILYKKLR